MKAEKPMQSEALRKIPSVMRVGTTRVPYHRLSLDPVLNAKLKAIFSLAFFNATVKCNVLPFKWMLFLQSNLIIFNYAIINSWDELKKAKVYNYTQFSSHFRQ